MRAASSDHELSLKATEAFFVFYVGKERKTQITLVFVIKTGNKAETRPYCVTGIEDKKVFLMISGIRKLFKV